MKSSIRDFTTTFNSVECSSNGVCYVYSNSVVTHRPIKVLVSCFTSLGAAWKAAKDDGRYVLVTK